MEEDKPEVVTDPPRKTWLEATLADIAGFDFEAPIAGSKATSAHELSTLYYAAAEAAEKRGEKSAHRVFLMLAVLTQMYPRPKDPKEPYGPMVVLTDGQHTPVPANYRGKVEELSALAGRATNHVLRARLADITWLLQRKRFECAHAALESYVAIVNQLDAQAAAKNAAYKNEPDIIAKIRALGALAHDASDYLRRALHIGHAIGSDKPVNQPVRDLAKSLRQRSKAETNPTVLYRWSYLDLEFGLSEAAQIGADIETYLSTIRHEDDVNSTVNLWRLAADAYHTAGREADYHRCLFEASNRWARAAEDKTPTAMLAAHYLSSAITQLNGVPNMRERREELRGLLIRTQARIGEEMQPFGIPLEHEELSDLTEKAFQGKSLKEQILAFARITKSPTSEELLKQAKEVVTASPLASMFETAHLDREGKTTSLSPGSSHGDTDDEDSLKQQVHQIESFRRARTVAGLIDPARRLILDEHYLTEDVFYWLMVASPVVSPELRGTFARAFIRFFQYDMPSALYTLTPLLENVLRYVLKQRGKDTSTIDTNTREQKEKTLTQLLESMSGELEAFFGKPLLADLDHVFNARPGPALRHSLAHGLLHDGTPYDADAIYACWLMFHICVAPLHHIRDQLQLPIDD